MYSSVLLRPPLDLTMHVTPGATTGVTSHVRMFLLPWQEGFSRDDVLLSAFAATPGTDEARIPWRYNG